MYPKSSGPRYLAMTALRTIESGMPNTCAATSIKVLRSTRRCVLRVLSSALADCTILEPRSVPRGLLCVHPVRDSESPSGGRKSQDDGRKIVGKLHVNRINQASFAMVMTLAACANPSVPLDSGAGGGTTAGTAGSGAGGGSAGGGTTVGTGGGGPMGSWKNTTSNLANLPSECGNMTSVTVKPDEDMIIAGVAQNGLWASTDGGASWSALGTGMGSAKIINRPTQVIFDPNDKNRFWEVGIYSGGGVFETHDHGVTFTQLGMVSHCDLAAVDFTDPDRK